VLDQAAGHIGQHRLSVGGLATEVVKFLSVSHGDGL